MDELPPTQFRLPTPGDEEVVVHGAKWDPDDEAASRSQRRPDASQHPGKARDVLEDAVCADSGERPRNASDRELWVLKSIVISRRPRSPSRAVPAVGRRRPSRLHGPSTIIIVPRLRRVVARWRVGATGSGSEQWVL